MSPARVKSTLSNTNSSKKPDELTSSYYSAAKTANAVAGARKNSQYTIEERSEDTHSQSVGPAGLGASTANFNSCEKLFETKGGGVKAEVRVEEFGENTPENTFENENIK